MISEEFIKWTNEVFEPGWPEGVPLSKKERKFINYVRGLDKIEAPASIYPSEELKSSLKSLIRSQIFKKGAENA